jgi:SAM-dependent methyltransferase
MSTAPESEASQYVGIKIDEHETDSALGDDISTYTESVRSSLFRSVYENGRLYHRYQDGAYILPEDGLEQERLDMQHAMFLRALEGNLILAPVEGDIHEVLDLGTGTGIWAIEFADARPESNVLGIDLSPIQPDLVPPNAKFEVDDFDQPWTYDRNFDLIHARMLLTASADFPTLFRQSFDALQPGGWFEIQDLYMPLLCDDGTMQGTALQEWNDKYMEACRRIQRDPSWTAKYKQWLVQAGFVNVEEKVVKWPVGPWAKDPTLKELGLCNQVNMLEGLDGFTVRLWTMALGMTPEEIQVFLVQVRKDLRDRRIHSYWPV